MLVGRGPLPVGKRRGLNWDAAAVCAATMFSFRSIHNRQCRDLMPLWGKKKCLAELCDTCLPRNFTQCNVVMSDYVQTLPSTSCADRVACSALGLLQGSLLLRAKARTASANSLALNFPLLLGT